MLPARLQSGCVLASAAGSQCAAATARTQPPGSASARSWLSPPGSASRLPGRPRGWPGIPRSRGAPPRRGMARRAAVPDDRAERDRGPGRTADPRVATAQHEHLGTLGAVQQDVDWQALGGFGRQAGAGAGRALPARPLSWLFRPGPGGHRRGFRLAARTAPAPAGRGVTPAGRAPRPGGWWTQAFRVRRMLSTGCDGGFAAAALLRRRCSGPRWRSVPTRTFAHREVALAHSAAGPGTGCRLLAGIRSILPMGIPACDDKEVM